MQKIKMSGSVSLSFEDGCNNRLGNCRQRNLRDCTKTHYRQSYPLTNKVKSAIILKPFITGDTK